MKYKLKDYQEEIVDKIITTPKVGIFVGMGLGKTLSTLHAVYELMVNRCQVNRVLIIAPKRVAKMVWQDEIKKWGFPFTVSTIMGSKEKREQAVKANAHIYVINRDNVVWLAKYLKKLSNWKWDMVIVDESSSFKTHNSKRFKALASAYKAINRMVLLSGTPAPRGYVNLWSQIFLLDYGKRLEPTITAFRYKYLKPDKSNGPIVYSWSLAPFAEIAIQNQVHDICYGLESNIRIPTPVINDVYIEFDDKIKKQYKQFKKDLLMQIEGQDVVALTAGVLSNKLLQFSSGAIYTDDGKWVHVHDEKIDALQEIVDSEDGNNILVMYNYKHERERILKAFPQAEDLDERKWNSGKQRLALAHPASCGHGLNLQEGGHIMVWFSPSFDLELYQQANARLNRTGQTHTVVIHRLLCRGTRDIEAIKALSDKKYTQESFMKSILIELQE